MASPFEFRPKIITEEAKKIKNGELQQIGNIIAVLLTAAGIVTKGGAADSSGWVNFGQNANGLALHAHIALPSGGSTPVLVSSSQVGRVFVQFNRDDNPWMSFSLIANSFDWVGAVGTIYRVRFSVETTDAAAYFYFTPLTAFGLESSARAGGGSVAGSASPNTGQ